MHTPHRRLFVTALTLAASVGVVVALASQSRTAHAQGDTAPPKAEAKEPSTCTCCAGLIPLSKWPDGKDVFNELMTDAVIIELAPEDTKVKKGDIVGKLDDRARRGDLMRQRIEVLKAQARLGTAKSQHTVAEIELRKYVEGTSKQELQLAAMEIDVAKTDLARSDSRAKEAAKLFEEGRLTEDRKTVEDLNLQRAKIALEQAEIKLKVLKEFQIEMKTKELQSKVESCKADALEKQALFEMAQADLAAIQRDMERYTLRAPVDGVIRHAQGVGPDGRPRIEKGAFIKPRQWILRVVTADQARTGLSPAGSDAPSRQLTRAKK